MSSESGEFAYSARDVEMLLAEAVEVVKGLYALLPDAIAYAPADAFLAQHDIDGGQSDGSDGATDG